MRFRDLIGVTFAGALGFTACDKPDDNGQASLDGLAARYAEVQCKRLESCCRQGNLSYDAQACRTGITALVQENIDELKALKVGFDAQATDDCLAGLAAISDCGSDAVESIPSCDAITHGLVQPGGACVSYAECAQLPGKSSECTGVRNSETGTVTPGVCATRTLVTMSHGKQGEPCSHTCNVGSPCVTTLDENGGSSDTPNPQPFPGDGVACYRADSLACVNNKCEPLAALGQPCNGNYDSCVAGTFCKRTEDIGTAGVCTAPGPAGTPCNGSRECQSGRCQGGESATTCASASVSQAECSGLDID